jgi:putative ABC transport system substrate-binding protein
MRRRDLMLLLGGATIATRDLCAQQKPMPVIGFFTVAAPSAYRSNLAAFRQGLSDVGYVEGQNLAIEYRWAEGRYDRLPALAAELVGRKVDLILATGGDVPALAAKHATSTIPIVFISGGDPVADGLVASLSRPGGNITGITILTTDLQPKRLELLLELVPGASVVVALLTNPNSSSWERNRRIIDDMQQAARAKGLLFHVLRASTEGDIDTAFATLGQLHTGALVVGSDSFFFTQREQLVALASRYAIPAIYEWREFTALGGLMSYGTSVAGAYRLAGTYCGKILKGAKPADLPVEQPTRFELVINLKTAKALGLTVPPLLLAHADEVIE